MLLERDLARVMHGEITVTSQPGKGSTFTLSFPRQGRAAALALKTL